MFSIKYKLKLISGLFILSLFALLACNKEFEAIPTAPQSNPPVGSTINEIINTDTSYSFFKSLVSKAGLNSVLSNNGIKLTVYAPDNNAFIAAGIPSVDAMPTATAKAIVSYNILLQPLATGSARDTFSNLQYPTFFNPAPTLSPFLRLSTFAAKRGNQEWVNNVPITGTGVAASNGTIYKPKFPVLPPSKSIFDTISKDASLSFFVAALSRADSGRTTIAQGSLTEALKSIGANLTLFVPTDDAVKALLVGMGLPPVKEVFAAMPVNDVRGIVAYHILPYRAFSINMPTSGFVPTLLNSSIPAHLGVNIDAEFSGPIVVDFKVNGIGNGGNAANVISKDYHSTNGVIHRIDAVLLPQ